MRIVTFIVAKSLFALACTLLVSLAQAQVRGDRAAQYRNLGKAFYENPATATEAVAEFKKALDLAPNSPVDRLNYALALLRAGKQPDGIRLLREVQAADPSLPHTWFNLGIEYKKNGDAPAARAQFERLVELVPNEAKGHYQIGSIDLPAGRVAEAIGHLERAAGLDPLLAAAQFQLYTAYRQAGREQDSANALARFEVLRASQQNSVTPEDVNWSRFSEIYDEPDSGEQIAPIEYREKFIRFAGARGLAVLDRARTGDADLIVWSDAEIRLFLRGGAAVPGTGLARRGGTRFVAAGDFNNDGSMDLCVIDATGATLLRNRFGRFVADTSTVASGSFDAAVWVDYDHDYDLDLLLFGQMPAVIRNEGSAGFRRMEAAFPFSSAQVTMIEKLRVTPDSKAFDIVARHADGSAVLYRDLLGGRYKAEQWTQARPETRITADFNRDGFPDDAMIVTEGVRLSLSRPKPAARWVRIQLRGQKSLRLAQDAEVEVKAGSYHSKQIYAGVPLAFLVGGHKTIDTVRITWPNGLIQNETRQATNRLHFYREAQRLSGSCPMIWSWNGREFQFITDVLGVAPLGASDGEGSYFPVDHDEYVLIPGKALVARDGRYEVRVTEELAEVSYLDQIQLFAVDHPDGTALVTNEKFKGPPYPEARLFTPARRIRPRLAVDDQGKDVLRRLAQTDRSYPDGFGRSLLGVAKQHYLELDFGQALPDGRGVLFLNGWVDWPDGSTFRAAAQELKDGLLTPRLEMQDETGSWQVVNTDMGMPAGKPKMIAVPVEFPSKSRRLRIVTNLAVYWDEIWMGEDHAAQTKQTEVLIISADLHFRGFASAAIDSARRQPDTYRYLPVKSESFWNPTQGMYTRYGDVGELVAEVDDRMAIIGSGDEIALEFDASTLSAPQDGWIRDFLLKVDGWAKDRDPNTAHSATVEPLPFHAMSQYPYAATEQFPNDAAHKTYREAFNTRSALRLIRPLEAGQ